MNLLHVVARFHLGGSEVVATHLCTELSRRGHTCHIVAITTPDATDRVGDAMKDQLYNAGVGIHEFQGSSFRRAAVTAPLRLARLWSALKPDIVHSHTDRPDFVVSLASRLKPMNVSRTIHNTSLWGTHFLLGYIAETGFKDDLVISLSKPSQDAYRALRKRYGLEESSFQQTISNGVIVPAPENRARREDLVAFDANLSRIQLCYAGRFTHQKGVDVLVAALDRLDPATLERLEVHAFGAGELLDPVAAQVKERSLPVHFHAPVPQISRLLSAFDAVVVPSRFEGQPLVALEALVLGVPVIATAAPGLKEVFPGAWPLLANVDDAESLAAQLTAFAVRPTAFAQLVRDTASWACARYDPERMIEAYEAAYLSYIRRM